MVAQFDGKNGGFDPYRGFKFRLHWDGRVVAGVSKVAALDRLDGQVQHRELGNASAHDKPPTATAFEVVTIERGITYDREFEQWASQVETLGIDARSESALEAIRKDIVFEIHNESGQLAIGLRLLKCWVSEFQAVPEVGASTSAVAILKMSVENEGWARHTVTRSTRAPRS